MKYLVSIGINGLFKTLGRIIRLQVFPGMALLAVSISYSQVASDRKVSLNVQNESLSETLKKIENEANVSFVYAHEIIPAESKVFVRAEDKPLDSVLKEILDPLNIQYLKADNQIVLKNKPLVQQTGKGSVSGYVRSKDSGEGLAYASIQLDNSAFGAISDENGYFKIAAIPTGEYMLKASFMGFEKMEMPVTILANENVEVVFPLVSIYEELEGVTVTGMRKGEVKALNRMKTAENIKYILSQEQIERFPDQTVGESLQRVPGVAVSYSYGLPNEVIIRGLDQSLSSVQVNGTRMPSTSTSGRNTDLNGILSNTIESIEVIKTLTPDQDADGTGGTVNIVTKSPTSKKPYYDIKGSLGYNNLVDKGNYDLSANFGYKPGKFGYLVGASYMRSNRGQHRVQKEYDDYDLPDGTTINAMNELRLISNDLRRDNVGLNVDLTYDPNPNTNLYLRGSYNYYYEMQHGPEINIEIEDYETSTTFSDASISKERNWRDYNRNSTIASAGGKTNLNTWNLTYDLTFTYGIYDQPIYYGSAFDYDGPTLSGSIDYSDPHTPQVTFDNDFDPMDPSYYTTDRYINRTDESEDRDIQATLHVSKDYEIGNMPARLKFGGRYKNKYNNRTRSYYRHDLIDGDMVMSDFVSSYKDDDFYNGAYSLYGFPDAEAMENYYQNNKELFEDDEDYIRQNTDPDSYEGNENLMAAYLMSTFFMGPVEVVTGVRYERTNFDYIGNSVSFDQDGNYIETIPIDTEGSFSDFFPSINVKYQMAPNTNFRVAATRSLSRPNYYDLAPWEEVSNDDNELKRGNPDLTQATSVNIDALFEHYFKSAGMLSGGFFYKHIKNYIYETNYTEEGGVYDGYDVEETVNGADADVYGFELAWQQQLTFLPGFLNGFGVYLNYTYVHSTFMVPGETSDREVALPEMRPHVGNISLSYEKYGFSGRISAYVYDKYILELASEAKDDEYMAERLQLDISASQRLSERLSIYMGLSNVTNAPTSTYQGTKARPFEDQVFSWWGNVGFRFNIQ